MYRKILVALDNSLADQGLLPHVTELAQKFGSQLLLVHVADGWVARHFEEMRLAESEEMKADRQYLEATAEGLRQAGLEVATHLALGEPSAEILRLAQAEHCEMIAMAGHGHGPLADWVYGSTIAEVRHKATVPVFLVRNWKSG